VGTRRAVPRPSARFAGAAYEATLLTATLFAFWVATLSADTTAEVITGAIVAVTCAVLAVAARRLLGQIWRPVPRWVVWVFPVLAAVPADTARLLLRTLPRLIRDRTGGGQIERVRPPVHEEPSRAGFRRAWGTVLLSATPGTIVLDWPPDGAEVVIHELGSGAPRMEKVVTR
jgi:multisubunit Na+/H+ antiporter MnhE subunit